uniref:Uncharacterized protein n=1 Tax=Panagrolaimus sp. JU765 TaxID=591449 RepID=A0AC34QQR9_9BILA
MICLPLLVRNEVEDGNNFAVEVVNYERKTNKKVCTTDHSSALGALLVSRAASGEVETTRLKWLHPRFPRPLIMDRRGKQGTRRFLGLGAASTRQNRSESHLE